MLAHLAPAGSMALLLANGSMSSNTNNEGEIRKKLIEDDYVECMVALPGQLFTNTQIPACIWFLTRDKRNGLALNKTKRDRRGQFLFIDARQLGYMKDRVLRDFTVDDIKKVMKTCRASAIRPSLPTSASTSMCSRRGAMWARKSRKAMEKSSPTGWRD